MAQKTMFTHRRKVGAITKEEWQLLVERKPDDSRLVQIIYYTGRVDKARYREYVNEKNKDIWTDEDGCIIEKTSIHAWRDF